MLRQGYYVFASRWKTIPHYPHTILGHELAHVSHYLQGTPTSEPLATMAEDVDRAELDFRFGVSRSTPVDVATAEDAAPVGWASHEVGQRGRVTNCHARADAGPATEPLSYHETAPNEGYRSRGSLRQRQRDRFDGQNPGSKRYFGDQQQRAIEACGTSSCGPNVPGRASHGRSRVRPQPDPVATSGEHDGLAVEAR